jgi:antirestriction protein
MNAYTPQVRIACLDTDNNTILHEEWVNVPYSVELVKELEEAIQNVLRSSRIPNAKDYAIVAYKGFLGAEDFLGKHPTCNHLTRAAMMIVDHRQLAVKLIARYDGDILQAFNVLTDCYIGTYKSLRDYAEKSVNEKTVFESLSQQSQAYFDFERTVRDKVLKGDLFTIELADDQIAVFYRD